MGVLKGTEITLIDGTTKKIEDLDYTEDILSCIIRNKDKNVNDYSKTNELMDEMNDVVYSLTKSQLLNNWSENVNIYLLINNKLKISLDHSLYTKNEEGIFSWNNAKSIRKGDFLLNNKLEYEKVSTLKKIKEKTEVICLSIADKTFFADGYLIHNTSSCDACSVCSVYYASIGTMGYHHYNDDSPQRKGETTTGYTPNSSSYKPDCRANPSSGSFSGGPAGSNSSNAGRRHGGTVSSTNHAICPGLSGQYTNYVDLRTHTTLSAAIAANQSGLPTINSFGSSPPYYSEAVVKIGTTGYWGKTNTGDWKRWTSTPPDSELMVMNLQWLFELVGQSSSGSISFGAYGTGGTVSKFKFYFKFGNNAWTGGTSPPTYTSSSTEMFISGCNGIDYDDAGAVRFYIYKSGTSSKRSFRWKVRGGSHTTISLSNSTQFEPSFGWSTPLEY